MKRFTLLLISVITLGHGQSQDDVTLPVPKIGWDSLQNYVVYPEIARRSGLEGLFRAYVSIDSMGIVTKVRVTNDFNEHDTHQEPTIIHAMIDEKLRSIQWHAATMNGRSVSFELILPFVFILDRPGQLQPIFKHIEAPGQQRNVH